MPKKKKPETDPQKIIDAMKAEQRTQAFGKKKVAEYKKSK
jgi:hypothetical protein